MRWGYSTLSSSRQHEWRTLADDDRVLVMHREHAIVRAERPAVRFLDDPRRHAREHGLAGDSHPLGEHCARTRVSPVRYARRLVDAAADAVAGELAHDHGAFAGRRRLHGTSDLTKRLARACHRAHARESYA